MILEQETLRGIQFGGNVTELYPRIQSPLFIPRFGDEYRAACSGNIIGWRVVEIPFTPLIFGTNQVDEGDAYLWRYRVHDKSGFLVYWFGGTRLRIEGGQLHSWYRIAVEQQQVEVA